MTTPSSHSFASEADYRAAIDATLAAAGREIRIFDQDLARMALEDSSRVATLAAFLAAGRDRRLRVALHNPDRLERHSPRLIGLIHRFGHAVEVRRTPDHLRQLADAWVLADRSHGAIRFHADRPRGKRVTNDQAEIHPWWQRFEELWEACEPLSPGTAAGL